MKKTFSVVLALVLALAMTVTTFAVVDPSVDADIHVNSGTVTVNGKDVELTDANMNEYVQTGEAKQTVTEVPAGYAVAGSADVTLAEGVTSATLTFTVVGAKKGESVVVKYYMNGEWIELSGTVVADGQVEVTVPGSGTIAVMVAAAPSTDEPTNSPNPSEPTESQNPSGTTTTTPGGTTGTGSTTTTTKPAGTTGTGSTTSPKTGETNAVLLISLMAVAFAGVAVVAAKKADA